MRCGNTSVPLAALQCLGMHADDIQVVILYTLYRHSQHCRVQYISGTVQWFGKDYR